MRETLLRPFRVAAARPRLLAAAATGIAVGLVLTGLRPTTRILVGWNIGIALHLVLVWWMMARSEKADMQARADDQDAGAAVVLLLAVIAALASLAAIGAELHGAKSGDGPPAYGRFVLAGTTILLSWLFVHTMFALHYAHDFYAGEDDRRGLRFPGDRDPDYWDFLYFSANLGAAGQTSDVVIEAARMRRFALAHTVLSFLFNTSILALAINVGASLL